MKHLSNVFKSIRQFPPFHESNLCFCILPSLSNGFEFKAEHSFNGRYTESLALHIYFFVGVKQSKKVLMSFIALTPHQPGIKIERWVHETRSIYPIAAGGIAATAILAYCSQRYILIGLAAANTATLLVARHFSGVMDPERSSIDAEKERRQLMKEAADDMMRNSSGDGGERRPRKKMTDAKYQTRKKMEADRLLLASGSSMVCGAWAAQLTMHVARIFLAPTALAQSWRGTASLQVGVAGIMALLMAYKCNVEAQIAYCHRFDF